MDNTKLYTNNSRSIGIKQILLRNVPNYLLFLLRFTDVPKHFAFTRSDKWETEHGLTAVLVPNHSPVTQIPGKVTAAMWIPAPKWPVSWYWLRPLTDWCLENCFFWTATGGSSESRSCAVYKWTNIMRQSPWQTRVSSATQDILHVLRNTTLHHRVQKVTQFIILCRSISIILRITIEHNAYCISENATCFGPLYGSFGVPIHKKS